ncbi:MAG: taurine dioxygenase [Gammaproteobacteria bacterium]|nr:taurine dioxygenase [Gammaproteobacteria bacterium]
MPASDFSQAVRSESQRQHNYHRFTLRPLNGALGAEILGVDFSQPIDDGMISEIRRALLNHMVVIFRTQNVSPSRLAKIGRYFGDLHINPFVSGTDDVKEVISIRSEENHEKRFTGLWHSDISWGAEPSMGSLLYAVTLPDCGGDTLFANMNMAYDTLSPGYKALLGGLKAEHRVDRFHHSKAQFADTPTPVIHPVIRTHPETHKKSLFVNEYFTSRFENMSEEESRPMLDYLFEHAVRPDFTCRIQWSPGTLVFWDNRCTQHYATNDYSGQRRLMHRVTVAGDRPY